MYNVSKWQEQALNLQTHANDKSNYMLSFVGQAVDMCLKLTFLNCSS